ncbi:MAG TPA: hypothetical protein VKS60_07905, partial [Stellaceae bacterium]|nr:hypothetical protein [Stellaceae bacterium]
YRYLVPVLAVPDETAAATAAGALRFAAVRLFVERACAATGTFELRDCDSAYVGAICRRLDGIALAIELAAPRLRFQKPAELLARLDERFSVLIGRGRTALPRQQTLMAAIDWSHDLLSPPEQALFRRLSVFFGSWTLESATAVAADELLDRHEIFELLGSLVDKSLVVADQSAAETRFYFLETMREYAAQKLVASGESRGIRQLAEYLVGRLRQAEKAYETASTADWLATYGPELDNVRAALAWAFGHSGEILLGQQLASLSRGLWVEHHLAAEQRRWVEAAAAALSPETPPDVAARILMWRAIRSTGLGARSEDAERAVGLARAAGDPLILGRSVTVLASTLIPNGLDQARSLLEEAAAIALPMGACRLRITVLSLQATVALDSGEEDLARRLLLEEIAMGRALGQVQIIHRASLNLAELLSCAGDRFEAIRMAREALASSLLTGDRSSESAIGANLAGYLLIEGETSEAVGVARQALRQAIALGQEVFALCSLQHLALAALRSGAVATALRLQGYVDAAYRHDPIGREATERTTSELVAMESETLLAESTRIALLSEGAGWSLEEAAEVALSWSGDRGASVTAPSVASIE